MGEWDDVFCQELNHVQVIPYGYACVVGNQITRFAVDPRERRRMIGTHLLTAIRKYHSSGLPMGISIDDNNASAARFLMNHGTYIHDTKHEKLVFTIPPITKKKMECDTVPEFKGDINKLFKQLTARKV